MPAIIRMNNFPLIGAGDASALSKSPVSLSSPTASLAKSIKLVKKNKMVLYVFTKVFFIFNFLGANKMCFYDWAASLIQHFFCDYFIFGCCYLDQNGLFGDSKIFDTRCCSVQVSLLIKLASAEVI